MKEFTLPDLGEGLQEAEVVEWLVSEGDVVEQDQLVVSVETAKAIVDIPAPVDAVIGALLVNAGETVAVGAPLFSYRLNEEQATDISEEMDRSSSISESKHTQDHQLKSKATKATAPESVSVVGQLQENSDHKINAYEVNDESCTIPVDNEIQRKRRESGDEMLAPAGIRAFAKKLGLENRLHEFPWGELNEAKLLDLYQQTLGVSATNIASGNPSEHVIKLSGARKVMAQTMTKSHQHIPAVTLFDDANITHWKKGEDITLRVIRAMLGAIEAVPLLNAWFDEENLSVQLFDDVHLGVAVNARDGLFVPVIRKIQELDDSRIRDILNKQIEQVENRTIKPQKLLGATISVSNFGTLSGRYATPIIVPPQVAIVGVGKITEQAVVQNGELAVGKIMPLSLSFDHRSASGADAAAFMSAMITALQE